MNVRQALMSAWCCQTRRFFYLTIKSSVVAVSTKEAERVFELVNPPQVDGTTSSLPGWIAAQRVVGSQLIGLRLEHLAESGVPVRTSAVVADREDSKSQMCAVWRS
eukprot:SAG31_NODE_259_length_18917_cov_28.559677_5_plen_106_part_00